MELVNTWEELIEDATNEPVYLNITLGNRIVRLASLPATEVLAFLEDNNSDDRAKQQGSTLRFIARCIVNKDGDRIGRIEDIEKLKRKAPQTLVKLRDGALEVNGLRLKPEDEPLKNDSREADTSASRIDSPTTSSDQT